jgi:hypothetical protein
MDAGEGLKDVLSRVETLRKLGRPPYEAVLSPSTWERLKAEHRRSIAYTPRQVTGLDALGVRVRLRAEAQGVVLKFIGGSDPPAPN